MRSKSRAIGIDLGTTYSCVGVWVKGKVKIIPNGFGNNTTPSCVAFTNSERLVGDEAMDQCISNPKNTIFGIKRLIGRNFTDKEVQADIKDWPFKVINKCNKPMVQVEFKNKYEAFAPEEISSMILAKMKESAEEYLGAPVLDAVITVPAYFNNGQRQATKDAGLIAGLNVLRVLSEPTAAALAYGIEHKSPDKRTVFVFDFGGGTFDVSILNINNNKFKVLAAIGDTHLGGEDFDNRLIQHCLSKIKELNNKDLTGDSRAIKRLRLACERVKRKLSSSKKASIEIDALFDGIDFHISITRSLFEELCSDLFEVAIQTAKEAIKQAKISRKNIHDIILVGGSTRIPKIQEQLSNLFHGRELNKMVNPDEAVAYGAAVHAAVLSGKSDSNDSIKDVELTDVTPLTLGLRSLGGIMASIIPRNTPVPAKKSSIFSTSQDFQDEADFEVYEGESSQVKRNRFIGNFQLGNIKQAKRGVVEINVTFRVDVNGILTVTAKDLISQHAEKLVVSKDQSRLPDKEIQRMITDAKKFRADDLKAKSRIDAHLALEDFVYHIRDLAQSKKLSKKIDRSKLLDIFDEELQWLNDSEQKMATESELRERLTMLEDITNPIIYPA